METSTNNTPLAISSLLDTSSVTFWIILSIILIVAFKLSHIYATRATKDISEISEEELEEDELEEEAARIEAERYAEPAVKTVVIIEIREGFDEASSTCTKHYIQVKPKGETDDTAIIDNERPDLCCKEVGMYFYAN